MEVNFFLSEHIIISLKVKVSANLSILDCCQREGEMVLKGLTQSIKPVRSDGVSELADQRLPYPMMSESQANSHRGPELNSPSLSSLPNL